MVLTANEGYEIWSGHYDSDPNPLLALESRILQPRLGNLKELKVLDVAAGTGRWMSYAASQGASTIGIDASPQMLHVASQKRPLSRRLVLGDMRSLPFRSGSVDLAICSFALSYVPFASGAFSELARVARRIVVSDLHPAAMLKGWKRSFHSAGRSWKIDHFYHSPADLERIARAVGMKLQWTMEAVFDLPELPLFELAGKPRLFDDVSGTPAVFAASWINDKCE
jgi:ubiquinone/menaquinone biosynthesis C-methylase UbiE